MPWHGWHLLGLVICFKPVPPHVRHPARREGGQHISVWVVVPSLPVPLQRPHLTL